MHPHDPHRFPLVNTPHVQVEACGCGVLVRTRSRTMAEVLPDEGDGGEVDSVGAVGSKEIISLIIKY